MGSWARRGKGALALALALVLAGRAGAQATLHTDDSWTLEGSKGGYCIRYLADPVLARELVPKSASLVPAGSGGDLPILLAGTIKEEPKFAQWVPGAICIGFYQRVISAGHTIAQARSRPIMIATNSIAAQAAHGVPGANQYLIDFMTDDRSVASAADRIGVDMSAIEMVKKTHVEGDDPTVTISFAGVKINWSGHAVADSSVGKTHSVSFGYGGPKSAAWLVTNESTPQSARLMVAVLWVEGKNSFAKVLQTSPVRAIGPEERGGSATLTFHAVTRK